MEKTHSENLHESNTQLSKLFWEVVLPGTGTGTGNDPEPDPDPQEVRIKNIIKKKDWKINLLFVTRNSSERIFETNSRWT